MCPAWHGPICWHPLSCPYITRLHACIVGEIMWHKEAQAVLVEQGMKNLMLHCLRLLKHGDRLTMLQLGAEIGSGLIASEDVSLPLTHACPPTPFQSSCTIIVPLSSSFQKSSSKHTSPPSCSDTRRLWYDVNSPIPLKASSTAISHDATVESASHLEVLNENA